MFTRQQWFLPRDACIKRGLSRHAVSVCLSVCVSICHVRTICRKFFHTEREGNSPTETP